MKKTGYWISKHSFLIISIIFALMALMQNNIVQYFFIILAAIALGIDVILDEIRTNHELTQQTILNNILTVLGNLEKYQKIYQEIDPTSKDK